MPILSNLVNLSKWISLKLVKTSFSVEQFLYTQSFLMHWNAQRKTRKKSRNQIWFIEGSSATVSARTSYRGQGIGFFSEF